VTVTANPATRSGSRHGQALRRAARREGTAYQWPGAWVTGSGGEVEFGLGDQAGRGDGWRTAVQAHPIHAGTELACRGTWRGLVSPGPPAYIDGYAR
jgi:hypothetical protein